MARWIGLAALVCAAFGWGLAAGAYDLFPYPQLRAAKQGVFGPEEPGARPYSMTEIPVISAERYAALETRAEIVMAGDSITASGRWDELFPEVSIVNRGVNGDLVGGLERRTDAILRAEPKAVFVMIGINDIAAGNTNAQIVERYRRIVDALKSGGAQVFVQSVLPCRDHPLGSCTRAMRDQAFALNRELESMAAQSEVGYIDLAASMADTNGFLARYSLDGVHPGSAGFAHWRGLLAPYIDEVQRDRD
ncbi:GDSL-type esterase/lipase family protein [Erythrobacter sp. JK5]|uniref:GDSL-type esterase/lipase family protein n=1 Tax=Erythrobacter sp. JK5 TaxID=2829500 RepID=UPI001BA6915D|nr:GDSL-type esterase/lipase family protein [Erythrobacter sp. JK5]QUL37341.1 hypothetical protein KDC96_13375 [Erythrobacter sp. JK5]